MAGRVNAGVMTGRWPLAFCVMLVITATILVYFYDKFWWPPDEGVYAYIAGRVLAGDVLSRDVQAFTMGYVSFVQALAFRLFGYQLVSLRLPLVAAGLIQACVIFSLFKQRGIMLAMTAAISLTALSFVQFLNPTAHWYSLLLIISIIGCLAWIPHDNQWRLFVVGLLLMTLFLFRQLSGAIAGIGVMAFLLFEAPRGATGLNTIFARALMTIMFIGLAGYLLAKANVSAFLLFGIWPLALLARGWFKATVANRYITRLLLALIAGGFVAALPLVAYHIHHGSLGTWFAETIVEMITLSNLGSTDSPSYFFYVVFGLYQTIALESFDVMVNGLFWASIVLTAPALGLLVLIDRTRRGETGPAAHPLPFLAVFYGLVSVHLQIPIYLFYTVGLSLTGLIWMLAAPSTRRREIVAPPVIENDRRAFQRHAGFARFAAGARSRLRKGLESSSRSFVISACVFLLSIVGLYYHAAQPLSRGLAGTFNGVRTELVPSDGLDRVGLSIEANDIAVYRHIVDLVRREVRIDQTILAMPVNPEIYFLTSRRSPFRFFNSALGIRSEADLIEVLQTIKDRPPQLVFYRPVDKYNTQYSDEVIAYVRQHYELLETLSGFEIYRYQEN